MHELRLRKHTMWLALSFLQLIVAQQPPAEPVLPWYAEASSQHFPQLFATDLQDSTFASILANSTDEYVLVDFYAPWCPHCQHFAPDYERLALAIRELDKDVVKNAKAMQLGASSLKAPKGKATAKTTILSATYDCVRYAHTCDFFGVNQFPTLLWGRRTDWLARKVSRLVEVDVDRNADSVASWINNRTHSNINPSHFSKADVNRLLLQNRTMAETAGSARTGGSAHRRQDREVANAWDAQLALALWFRQIFDHHAFQKDARPGVEGNPDGASHKTLYDLVDVLAARFPEVSKEAPCRKSLLALQDRLRNNVSSVLEPVGFGDLVRFNADRLEHEWRLCDTNWTAYSSGWHSCQPTWPGKRGFTCGLWNLFHMVAAQSDDKSAYNDMQVVRKAVMTFFDCQECRDHFAGIPGPDKPTLSRREAQLWWWQTHNHVNARVKTLEAQYDDGDPGFPKVQWPTEVQCPECYSAYSVPRAPSLAQASRRTLRLRGLSEAVSSSAPKKGANARTQWNLPEVSAFLERYYGKPSGEL